MILMTLITSFVFAQSSNAKKEVVQTIEFDKVNLTAKGTKPTGEFVRERERSSFGNLVLLRNNFQPEMLHSVNEIK